jgi:hypothetical protein
MFSDRESGSWGRLCQMDVISMKSSINHLLWEGGSWGLKGNKQGLDCNMELTGDEWRDCCSVILPEWFQNLFFWRQECELRYLWKPHQSLIPLFFKSVSKMYEQMGSATT